MATDITQSALVLHRRAYRETSFMVTLFTPEHGKINAIVKGVRSKSKAAQAKQAWLQPFQELKVSWTEKNALKLPGLVNLKQLEPTLVRFPLSGESSICGLYINELLYRLIYPNVAMEALFESYQQTLYELAKATNRADQAWVLRQFEYELLMTLGVAFQTDTDAHHQPIEVQANYRFYPELGAVRPDHDRFSQPLGYEASPSVAISGDCLLNFHALNLVMPV